MDLDQCRKCKGWFYRNTRHQKYCSATCRYDVANAKKRRFLRKAKKLMAAQVRP